MDRSSPTATDPCIAPMLMETIAPRLCGIVVCQVCRTHKHIVSHPGLLIPAIVACSTNTGEGLVTLAMCSDVRGRWMDVWRSIWHILSVQLWGAFWTQETSPRLPDVDRSVTQWCRLQSVEQSLVVFQECATPPHIHPTSMYVTAVTALGEFYQAFPHALVLQPTNAGVRRPGYKSTCAHYIITYHTHTHTHTHTHAPGIGTRDPYSPPSTARCGGV